MSQVARHVRRHNRAAIFALLTMLAACSSAGSEAPPAGSALAGEILSVSGERLVIRQTDGTDRSLTLTGATKVMEVSASSLRAITAGSYVGTRSTPTGDGTLTASEVHVFDQRLRGVGEGHRTLPSSDDSSMTNGAVEASMTNGSASNVIATGAAAGGQMMTVRYKGGEQKIRIPGGVPVVFMAPGTRAMLLPKAHVVVVLNPSSTDHDAAEMIKVGKSGFVPPL